MTNDAWGRDNMISTAGLGAAAVGWASVRVTEGHSHKLTGTEQALSQVKDGLMGVAVLTGIGTGVAGARLAIQVPDGEVPVETGTVPAPETPGPAARIQRAIGVLSTLNILSGVALVAVNGVLSQINDSHPSNRRPCDRPPRRRPSARRGLPLP